MNVKTSLTSLCLVVLLGLFAHPAIAAVTLTVEDNPVQAGSTDVPVPIKVSSDALLAGASFQVLYSKDLTFTGVSSTYFDTFVAQGFEAGERPACDLDGDGVLDPGECDPNGNGVPDAGEFFEQPLIISVDNNIVDGKKSAMIAAARVNVPNPVGTNTTILTLHFDTPMGTEAATYEVDVKRSRIQNAAAGYTTATVIPMLVGYDASQSSPANKYPEIVVSNVPSFPGVLNGTLTVTDGDTDNDDIADQWELRYVPSGTTNPLAYFSKTGDRDNDGYSDYQEYLNRNENDPSGNAYNPTVANAAGGTGYVPPQPGENVIITKSADFNGDGKSDVLLKNTATGDAVIWLMDGLHAASYGTIATFGSEWKIITATADFNGDGKSDVLLKNSTTGDAVIWLMDGLHAASYGTIANFGSEWKFETGNADFNGDGKSDVLLKNSNTGDIVIWLMDGLRATSYGTIATLGNEWSIKTATADFNGDGKTDVLLKNSTTGAAVIWLVDGLHATSYGTIATFGSEWKFETADADFNGDNKSDVLLKNSATGDAVIWLMDGLRAASYGTIATFGSEWKIITGNADFNNDDKTDVLLKNGNTGDIVIWLMNGLHAASYGTVATLTNVWDIKSAVADFNGDNKSDVLLKNSSTGDTVVWLMDGLHAASYGTVATLTSEWKIIVR